MNANLDGGLLAEALIELKGWYPGFRWESELWASHGHCRSPYRVLVLFGLSPRTKDAYLVEMCRDFFLRFPNLEGLVSLDVCESTGAPSIVRKGQIPFVKSLARHLTEWGEVPCDVDALAAIKGVGEKVAECVLAYGWGEDALPVDSNVLRVADRIFGLSATEKGRDVKVLREQLKWAYREASGYLAAASIAMIDIHEILRLHAQTCCGKTPDCFRCPLSRCRSRQQPATVEWEPVDPAVWDEWRELILETPAGP